MKPIGQTWRHARAKLDISVEAAAEALDIQPGSLRNIESEQPRAMVSERLAYRAERFYKVPIAHLVDAEQIPDKPPKQPKAPPKPPPKRAPTGPRRAAEDAA